MSKVRWAVVGCGRITMNRMLPAIAAAENAELTVTMSRSEESAQAAAEQFGAKAFYTDWDRFMQDDSFDVAFLGTPNYLHHPHTVALAKAGKHVLCDKPMAMNVAQCEQMIAACEAAGVKLMVAQMSRFNRYNQYAEKLMRDHLMSEIAYVRSDFAFWMKDDDDWRLIPEQSGGGALMDIGVYCIHHLKRMVGERIVSVQAHCTPTDAGKVDRTTLVILEFANGVPGMLIASFDVALGSSYTVAGPEGILSVVGSFNQNGSGDLLWQGQIPVMAPTMHEVDPYTMEVEHFSACIMNDARPAVDPRDSLDDVRVMMAIYESAKTGRKVKIRDEGLGMRDE